jgi:hypothetical protein
MVLTHLLTVKIRGASRYFTELTISPGVATVLSFIFNKISLSLIHDLAANEPVHAGESMSQSTLSSPDLRASSKFTKSFD